MGFFFLRDIEKIRCHEESRTSKKGLDLACADPYEHLHRLVRRPMMMLDEGYLVVLGFHPDGLPRLESHPNP